MIIKNPKKQQNLDSGHPHHSLENWKQSLSTAVSLNSKPCVSSCNFNKRSWNECHLLRISGIRLSVPGICWALTWNSPTAVINVISLRHWAWNLILVMPLFSTITYAMLSHRMEILFPWKNLPQSFRATITVNNSSALIWRCRSLVNCGNSPWKQLPEHQPRYLPGRQPWQTLGRVLTRANLASWICIVLLHKTPPSSQIRPCLLRDQDRPILGDLSQKS